MAGHEQPERAELAREVAAVDRPGPAERAQGERPGVESPLHRHHPKGPRHVVVDDGEDPAGGLLQPEPEGLRHPLAERGLGARRVEGISPSRRCGGIRPRTRLASVTVGSSPPRP